MSRRWEKWTLNHFLSPLFGGGAINLLYHVKTGLFYPRGSAGLDGWSLLWYDPVTAARLEKAVDRYLVRPNGLYYLNLDRT